MRNDEHHVIPLEKLVIESFEAIGGKNFIKQCIDNLSTDKKILLRFSDDRYISFQAKPLATTKKIGYILGSRKALVQLYGLFYVCMYNREYNIFPTQENMKYLLRAIVAHEAGHLLDESLDDNDFNYLKSVLNIARYYKDNDFDISRLESTSVRMRGDVVDSQMLDIKRLMIEREVNAWTYARHIMTFENDNEKKMFSLLKEYALATYNMTDLNSVARYYSSIKPYHKLLEMYVGICE